MGAWGVLTAEDLERMGERDFDYELVRGTLVPVTPAGREHGALAMLVGASLSVFVDARRLGRVYAAETGFILRRNPDTVRAPDVSFVSREREQAMTSWQGFINGAPDLAVEVRSPDDSPAGLARKAEEYLEAGAKLVWIVDPAPRQVRVHTPDGRVVILSGDATLEGQDALPGFALPLARLFDDLT